MPNRSRAACAVSFVVWVSVLAAASPSSARPALHAAAGATEAVPPLASLDVTRPFQPPPNPYGPGHRGVDLGGVAGEVVRNAVAGRVVFAGVVAGTSAVSVDIGGGERLTYEPVTPVVSAGEAVGLGAPLGALLPGHPGCPVAACLHWGRVLDAGDPRLYADPLALLGADQVRLLPWSGEPVDAP